MPSRSPYLTTWLFLGHPSHIKKPPYVSPARRQCFWVDDVLGCFLFCNYIVVSCYIYCRMQFFTVSRHLFKDISQKCSECLDTSQTDKTLKLHKRKLIMCCHVAVGGFGQEMRQKCLLNAEIKTDINIPERMRHSNRHIILLCNSKRKHNS